MKVNSNFQLLFFPCAFPFLLLYYFYAEFQNRITTVSIIFSQRTKKMRKILDIKIVGSTITQQLSNSATQQLSNSATQQLSNSATQQLSNSAAQGVRTACIRINGQLFQLDNNIIIVSHQFLQTASVLLGFFILNRKGRSVCGER